MPNIEISDSSKRFLSNIVCVKFDSSGYYEKGELFKEATQNYIIAMAENNLYSDAILNNIAMQIEEAINDVKLYDEQEK